MMVNRLSRSLLAAVALAAFAVSATSASAAPVITHPTGTVLPVGSKVVGTNVGEVALVTALGNVTCTSATLKGTVVANATASGSKGEVTSATFTGTGTNGECTSWNGGVTVNANPATNGLPWCLEETEAADVGRKRGGSCSSASRPIRFILTFTNIGACTYQRNTAAASTITTDEGVSATGAIVHLAEQEWTKFEGGALCPSSGKIKMSWTLKTESGEPLYFSS